jgi:hypothetical protein
MLCNFLNENLAVYEIKYGRARQVTNDDVIWRMRLAYWITEYYIQAHDQNM